MKNWPNVIIMSKAQQNIKLDVTENCISLVEITIQMTV